MAFVSSSKDLGQWVGVGHDPVRNLQVRFRLRRLDDDDSRGIERKLGKFVRDPSTGVKTRVIPVKRRREAALQQACIIWTGAQNLWVKLTAERDVQVYSHAAGVSGVKVGDEVSFDGDPDADHPHDDLKRMVLKSMVGLTNRVITHGLGEVFEDVDEDTGEDDDPGDDEGDSEYPEDEKEEDLKKTSSAPSSSTSPSQASGSG